MWRGIRYMRMDRSRISPAKDIRKGFWEGVRNRVKEGRAAEQYVQGPWNCDPGSQTSCSPRKKRDPPFLLPT